VYVNASRAYAVSTVAAAPPAVTVRVPFSGRVVGILILRTSPEIEVTALVKLIAPVPSAIVVTKTSASGVQVNASTVIFAVRSSVTSLLLF